MGGVLWSQGDREGEEYREKKDRKRGRKGDPGEERKRKGGEKAEEHTINQIFPSKFFQVFRVQSGHFFLQIFSFFFFFFFFWKKIKKKG